MSAEPGRTSTESTRHAPAAAQRFDVDLPPGSFVIERYVYTGGARGGSGVQWIAGVVGEDGDVWTMGTFRTRSEALDCIDSHGTVAARNAHD